MADKKDAVSEALVQAKVSLDEAVKRLQAGERLAPLTPGQLEKVRAQETLNTSCVNTGCGKPTQAQLAGQPG